MSTLRFGFFLTVALGLVAALAVSRADVPAPFAPAPGWKPTHAAPQARYEGSAACESCHKAQAASHAHTGMRGAASTAAECDILRDHPRLDLQSGAYAYRIERKGSESVYSVSNGASTIAGPILWCFGKGEAGQTYILERDGRFYESRVSYYEARSGLDYTMGAPQGEARSLEEAFGRAMEPGDARDCFGCHNTAAVSTAGRLQPEKMTTGVTCEGCHGPGAGHVEAVRAGRLQDARTFNPGRLGAEEQSNFCGSCHRTWAAVMLMGLDNVGNVRFQPYRLAKSRCYDAEDKRIRCSACHDVHQARERRPAAFDAKCGACHGPATADAPPGPRARACPKATTGCTTCHMPRYPLPGAHFDFTDHFIRVVRPGDPYPG